MNAPLVQNDVPYRFEFRFISWDLDTSEVCRDIDPGAQGLMLGLAVSSDNRFVASFTSSFQVNTPPNSFLMSAIFVITKYNWAFSRLVPIQKICVGDSDTNTVSRLFRHT